MITPEKIEEWIKEIQARPVSAPIILQYIANRLRDLTERNEQLLTENLALLSGKRVAEYEQKIAHLEYQLDLLKRQSSGDSSATLSERTDQEITRAPRQQLFNVLVYNQYGRLLRFEVSANSLTGVLLLGQIHGQETSEAEPPRILIVPGSEEIMFVFTSGRIVTAPASVMPEASLSRDAERGAVHWDRAVMPEEPRGGERLACLTPVSRLPVSDYFVQVSRRGFVKKIRTAMAQSILANHYLGSGVKQALDRTFNVFLGGKDDHIILVSHEGYLLRLELSKITSSTEEGIRLGSADHLAASCVYQPGKTLLLMTQAGKALQLTSDRLDAAGVLKTKGQSAFSAQRREKGARLVGAGCASEDDWAACLHQDGQLVLYPAREILASGTLPEQTDLLTFETFSVPGGKSRGDSPR